MGKGGTTVAEQSRRSGGSSRADLEECLTGLVNAVDKGMIAELAPYGLSPLEYALLRYCDERGECTATQLAEILPVDDSRVSRIVAGLVDRGLLRRRRLGTDRRVVMLNLTDEGGELLSRAVEHINRYGALLTAGVSESELRAFIDVASRIIDNYAGMRGSA